jgi:hypothetical protein
MMSLILKILIHHLIINLLLSLFLVFDMNQIFTILSGSEKSQIDSSDSNITFLIVDHELCLQKAYNDLYEKVVKVKKLN